MKPFPYVNNILSEINVLSRDSCSFTKNTYIFSDICCFEDNKKAPANLKMQGLSLVPGSSGNYSSVNVIKKAMISLS